MDARVDSSGDVEAARVHTLGEVDDRLLASPTDEEISVWVELLERLFLDLRELMQAAHRSYCSSLTVTRNS